LPESRHRTNEPAVPLPPLREVITRYNLSAKKSLGQNFLFDLNLTRRIARSAGDISGKTVIEIGPGPGGLTRALLQEGAHVIAIERDMRCRGAMEELADVYPGQLTIIFGDTLELDPSSLATSGDPPEIISNPPYNIATPLIFKWLESAQQFTGMTLTLQKEVAERITAAPRSKEYGRLSVMTQWRCNTSILFKIPPRAFIPPPKVTSMVIRLIPRSKPLAEADPDTLGRVVKAAFGQRRKMLRSAMKTLHVDTASLLEAADIPPTARAEELVVEQFCALARALPSQT
jgi:16S rRNA (adenine1518-N6/adenine1519-N6)-dimethyltransferase